MDKRVVELAHVICAAQMKLSPRRHCHCQTDKRNYACSDYVACARAAFDYMTKLEPSSLQGTFARMKCRTYMAALRAELGLEQQGDKK